MLGIVCQIGLLWAANSTNTFKRRLERWINIGKTKRLSTIFMHSYNQSINQFNSNLAAREPDSKWYVVEIIDKNSIRNKQCAWERCVEWVRKRKGKEADLYSAFIEVGYLTLKALRYGSHSVTCKLHRTCLYLVSIHQMAHPRLRLRTSNCSLLLIYLPRKDERLRFTIGVTMLVGNGVGQSLWVNSTFWCVNWVARKWWVLA